MKRTVLFWLVTGLVSFLLLPWHMTDRGVFSFEWLGDDTPSTGLTMALQAGQ